MCGRFNITSDPLAKLLLTLVNMPYSGEDNFNAAPTEQIPVVRIAPAGADNAGAPELVPMRWWLTPYWAKEMTTRYAMFNAKSETAAKSPAFREPYRKRRCVVPVTGFYEWTRREGSKVPYMISSRDTEGLLIAGLWDRWRNRETGEEVLSFTVLTTAANEALAFVHNRQPVMLSLEDARRWLDPDIDTSDLAPVFQSALPVPLEVTEVSAAVNNARNKSADVFEPVGAPVYVGPSH